MQWSNTFCSIRGHVFSSAKRLGARVHGMIRDMTYGKNFGYERFKTVRSKEKRANNLYVRIDNGMCK
jgi:hypothetical protein